MNHKRLFRLYQSEGLALPRKRPKRRLWQRPQPLMPATAPCQRWSIDFVADRFEGNRRFRAFTVVDDYSRECPTIHVDTSIGGLRVVRLLEELRVTRGFPSTIVCDNGPEFTSRAFLTWAEERGIEIRFIQPGKPTQNAFIESFNGRLREECLEAHWFTSLRHAREVIEAWRRDYNEVRPHSTVLSATRHRQSSPLSFGARPLEAHEARSGRLLRFQPGVSKPELYGKRGQVIRTPSVPHPVQPCRRLRPSRRNGGPDAQLGQRP
ncbi:MAG: IS3 family transposase [Thermoanaerobaculia bacterium]